MTAEHPFTKIIPSSRTILFIPAIKFTISHSRLWYIPIKLTHSDEIRIQDTTRYIFSKGVVKAVRHVAHT